MVGKGWAVAGAGAVGLGATKTKYLPTLGKLLEGSIGPPSRTPHYVNCHAYPLDGNPGLSTYSDGITAGSEGVTRAHRQPCARKNAI